MGNRVLKDHCTKRAAATKGAPGDTLASMLEPTNCVAKHSVWGRTALRELWLLLWGYLRGGGSCGANRLVCGF